MMMIQRTAARNASGLRSFAAGAARWKDVKMAPADPILGVTDAWKKDTFAGKINLGVGAYRDDDGKPVVLECVRKAEALISGKENMEYLPIHGNAEFIELSKKLVFDKPGVAAETVASVQALSGTGSCRLMGEFMKRYAPGSAIYLPNPTWSNHHNIYQDSGVEVKTLKYYDPATKGLDYDGLVASLDSATPGSFVLLHACAHNPTGVDPNAEQWKGISDVMKAKNLYPLFDMAYQGFASGNFEKDSSSINLFIKEGHNVAVCQSYAKNMGLYGQRVGLFSIMCDDAEEKARVESQLKMVARAMYSNPPAFGAMIAATVMKNPDLYDLWMVEVKGMADRINNMRTLLRDGLESSGAHGPWNHVTDQIGMFCYSGMTPEHVDELAAKHHIYMTRNGRISMAGVTTKNVGQLVEGMKAVINK